MFKPEPPFPLDLHPHNYDIMNDMKKVWIYKRKSIEGWWVGWYESGNRKAKALPSKELAEHFKQIKYTQLNSDVFTGQVLARKNYLELNSAIENGGRFARIPD